MSGPGKLTWVFAYGSLMEPGSLRSTLPGADLDSLVPASLVGHTRRWNVAFPNDGSQPDKAYFDEEGRRPPAVLFLNLVEAPGRRSEGAVNGVLVPVDGPGLTKLRRREGRYREVDVSDRLEPHPEVEMGFDAGRHEAVAFVGREAFTRERQVRHAVIPRSYVSTLLRAVSYWEERYPGFEAAFRASTKMPGDAELVSLRRVDL